MNDRVVFITGGHPTPALAVLQELQARHPNWRVYWLGRKYAFEGKDVLSSEYQMVAQCHIPFLPITTGRFIRSVSFRGIVSLFKIPVGFFQSIVYTKKYNPDLILTFGGYVAVPVAIAGFLGQVPIITHEQVVKPGLANRVISKLAKKICVSFQESVRFFPNDKTIVTGLPLRKELFHPPQHPSFDIPEPKLPILYLTGGSTGAVSMNELFFPLIPTLVQSYIIIHQTGDISLRKAETVRGMLGDLKERYIIKPYFDVSDVSFIYTSAELVVGRSGANTVSEISTFQKKAIFIPLPWAAGSEQETNARMYEKTGQAIVLPQERITEELFMHTVQSLLSQEKNHNNRTTHIESAARKIVDIIESI